MEREAHPVSVRDARQENRALAKKVQEKLAARRTPQTTQVEPNFIDETFQPGKGKERTPIPSFRTPRVINQEALIAFLLAAVGIERIFPVINNNQDSITKPIEEIHLQENLQHFCALVIHPTTGEIITSYKRLVNDL